MGCSGSVAPFLWLPYCSTCRQMYRQCEGACALMSAEHHRHQQWAARGAAPGPAGGQAGGQLGLPAGQLRHVHQLRRSWPLPGQPAQHQAPQARRSPYDFTCVLPFPQMGGAHVADKVCYRAPSSPIADIRRPYLLLVICKVQGCLPWVQRRGGSEVTRP